MLGHGEFNKSKYALQTVKDNIGLLTAEVLSEINTVVVEFGHNLCKKKAPKSLQSAIHSFLKQTSTIPQT